MSKKCRKCNEVLLVENFTKSSSTKDGYEGSCKNCRQKQRRAKHKHKCNNCEKYFTSAKSQAKYCSKECSWKSRKSLQDYHYKQNEIVNDSLIIIEQTRQQRKNGTVRAYEVQSIAYPDAPTYIIDEYSLKDGYGCAYSNSSRIYEGNSLYSVEWIRPYIIDSEEAKTLSPQSNKYINFKCPECSDEKKMKICNMFNHGFNCSNCSSNLSYGQLAFGQYQSYFGLGLETEKILKNLNNRRVDFVKFDKNDIVQYFVEIQGVQHTDVNSKWYKQAHEQDIAKRKWSKENNILMIEIDMRISSWEYFKEQINNCEYLPSINGDDEKAILKLMEVNKRYPTSEIIKLYNDGLSTIEIGEKYNMHHSVIGRVLKKNNVILRNGGARGKQKKLPEETIVNMYHDGLSTYKIAEKFGVTRDVITNRLKKNDVVLRGSNRK